MDFDLIESLNEQELNELYDIESINDYVTFCYCYGNGNIFYFTLGARLSVGPDGKAIPDSCIYSPKTVAECIHWCRTEVNSIHQWGGGVSMDAKCWCPGSNSLYTHTHYNCNV